jgi:hypothetical protein
LDDQVTSPHISQITDYLYISAWPRGEHVDEIIALGVHRNVAQATCVLIGMGYYADDAMRLIKEKRAVADPYAGYIQKRIRLFVKKRSDLKNS